MHCRLAILIPAVLMIVAQVPAARAGDALINSEVSVDSTGKDSADARSQAMAKGQMDALMSLLDKLAPPGQSRAIAESLDQKKIDAMVRGTEVLDERMSSNRYRARLRVNFDADMISELVGKLNSPEDKDAAAVTVGSFLIIPGYTEGDKSLLWEEENAWRNAWKAISIEITAGDIVVPYGDAKDSGVVSQNNLATANYDSLTPLILRYGVSDLVVLQTKYTDIPEMSLSVVKRRINRQGVQVDLQSFNADPQETKETLMLRAARSIVDSLRQKKTEEQSARQGAQTGEKNKVMMLASTTTLASWKQLRSKISALPMVDRLEMLAISPQQVDMILYYRGTPTSLANAITSENIRLTQNKDYWVVSLE